MTNYYLIILQKERHKTHQMDKSMTMQSVLLSFLHTSKSKFPKCGIRLQLHLSVKLLKTTLFFFFIRTSNFGAEAERSYIFLRFEAENVLTMFLNYMV